MLQSSAYVSSGLPAHTHQKWLEQLTIDICESNPGEMTPEMFESTSQVLQAWAQNPFLNGPQSNKARNAVGNYLKPSQTKDSHGIQCALAVEKILKRIVDERNAGNENACPTTAFYNAALQVWAMAASDDEKGAAAERAEQILINMQAMYEEGDILVQPDTQSFYNVILAWSLSREKYAPQRALQVLNWMIQLYETNVNNLALPDEECFTTVLNMVCKSGTKKAGKEAEEVFTSMEKFFPESITTQHFNLVLDAWKTTNSAEAARRSEDILNYMQILTEANVPNVRPNLYTYSIVIQTLSKSRYKSCPKRATAMLKRLETDYENGDVTLPPDNIIYNIVLDKWAKSGDVNAAQQARKILRRMAKFSESRDIIKCRPDVYSYTSVISACAQTQGSRQQRLHSYHIARETFDELLQRKNENLYPSHVTYGTMLKACAFLLPKHEEYRENEVRDIFSRCVDDGQVGDMVVSRLRQAGCANLFHELLEGHAKTNLPKEWTRNVKEKRTSPYVINKKRPLESLPNLLP